MIISVERGMAWLNFTGMFVKANPEDVGFVLKRNEGKG